MTDYSNNTLARTLSRIGFNTRLFAAVVAVGTIAACDVHSPSAPGSLASIVVTPNATLAVGGTQQMVAVGADADGRVISIAPTWSVAAAGGAISATGVFTAGTVPGVFANTATATVGSIAGHATITVVAGPIASIVVSPNPSSLAIGAAQTFTAVAKDAAGNIITFTPTWSVINGGGTITSAGVFTAGAATGTYANTVQASNNGVTGTATVAVFGALATMTVTPNPATLAVGATQQFTAVGKDAGGNVVPLTAAWSVTAGGGTIAATGLFTAGTVSGTFTNTVKATSGALTATATVIVTSGPLTAITVTPNPASMAAGANQQFTANGVDANGNAVVVTPVWSVVANGGTISATGLFTAGATLGTFNNTVKATSGTASATATVTVTAAVVVQSVSLGTAASFGVLAGSGISCAISGTINSASSPSNIGSSPTLTIGGFPPCTFTGSIPLPAVVATAKGDLTAAYLGAQGQVCNTVLTGFDLGFYDGSTPTKTLPSGVYCFATSAGLTGTLKLTGSAGATWVFQIGSTLNAEVGSKVILSGVSADAVTWAVGSSATLKTNAAFAGNILALASITLQNGATLNGRALAQTGAVDMTAGAATITKP